MGFKDELKKAYQDAFSASDPVDQEILDVTEQVAVQEVLPYETPRKNIAVSPTVHVGSADGTTISASTIVTGDIDTQDNLSLLGELLGDIACACELKIVGKLTGNASCESLVTSGAIIKGNLEARENIYLCQETRITGDIKGALAQINGRVKGNVTVTGTLMLGSTAVVVGDIVAAAIEMTQGAVVQGMLKMTGVQFD